MIGIKIRVCQGFFDSDALGGIKFQKLGQQVNGQGRGYTQLRLIHIKYSDCPYDEITLWIEFLERNLGHVGKASNIDLGLCHTYDC